MAEAERDLPFAGIGTLAARLRNGSLSPVDLVEASLARAAADRLGCFVTVTADLARERARRAAEELSSGRWRGPLHGIPVAVKDLFDTRGVPTTFGAAPFRDRVPDRDATLVRRLADAGAILVGKLSLIELAGGLGYTTPAASLTGACRTPWDPSRWAGGSSGGPAAAVAAGIVPLALGTETWGSIACPAAFCGVTGLRPTYGVLSRHGAMPLAYSMDKPGPLARSAEDCAIALSVLSGADPRDPSSLPPPRGIDRVRPELPRGVRIAVLPAPRAAEVSPGARDALAAAREVFASAGALVEDAELPDLPYGAVARVILEAEAANALEEVVRSGAARGLADPSHRSRTPDDYAPRASSADYVRAARVRGEVQRVLARFFERHDLVLASNWPVVPPRVDESLARIFAVPDPLSAAGNLAGLPAIAFPAGLAKGLPVSVQLVAPPLEEARLLAAAALFQSRTSHHLARPPSAASAPVAAAGAAPRARAGASVLPRGTEGS